MPRETIASLKAEIEKLKKEVREGEFFRLVAYDRLCGIKPDAQEKCEADGGRYVFSLYRAEGAHGGIVIVESRSKQHNPGKRGNAHVECRLLDEIEYPNVADLLPLRIAVERLKVARSRIWRGEEEEAQS